MVDRVNNRIANEISEVMDGYKVPHHGNDDGNCIETLSVYRPEIAVITNSYEYVSGETGTIEKLKKANRDVKILFTENQDVVIDLEKI